ncbi:SDR family NAD(P)-dependent oxidoreductase [Kutzneria sp. 744]|uniref:SDR family NAD(P)-dependent oxidoreductase n=1 Tax=Kutzneria sp. (strain 744) TaxID=345341 RepID=UPI0005BE5714|nr:SDR family NAD(P)-dependent oxidoreductase [Kutzneria sp. 744]
MSTRPVVVITGATNGLGRLVALDLAQQGARLAVVARDPDKAASLRRETEADVFIADLASLSDVRRVGAEIAARYDQVDVLVNNAGLHAFAQRRTEDGVAEMTAVNYLAPWLLTATLRDKLTGRVVNVASEAARQVKTLDPQADLLATEDFSRRESFARYGRTKLMDIMFTQELSRRLAGTDVTVNCCDPGFNTSGLGRELPLAGPLEKVLKALRIGDPRRGAGIIRSLCTDDRFATTTGGYFSHRDAKPLECPAAGRGEQIQKELWDATAALVGMAL